MKYLKLIRQNLSETRQYQLRAAKQDGKEDLSKWYDDEDTVLDMKKQIDEFEEYESTSIVKRIKEYQYEQDEEEIPATLEAKCKMEMDEPEQEQKPMQQTEKTQMINFSKFLTEELSTGALEKASLIILKYLRRKTGNRKIFSSQGLEKFKNSNSYGFGIRYYAPGKKIESFRFNWVALGSANFHNLHSIDLWKGNRQGPNFHMQFDQPISLVQILPILADILKKGKVEMGDIATLPDDMALMSECFSQKEMKLLKEAVDPNEAFDGVVNMISKPGFSKNAIYQAYKMVGVKIFDELERQYSAWIQKDGRQYVFKGVPKDLKTIMAQRDSILEKIGSVKGRVVGGAAVEKYAKEPELEALENQRERLSYTKQLEDLERLVKLTVAGAANALFIAGRGGVGKTYTVEKMLSAAGLQDGKGYFKNTGTASAAGIYSLLFKYKDSVILFDDSDDALKDQESRNMIKAATDTKKVRKLVWNKMGKNVVDPDGFDGSDDDMIDQGLLPRYFEFTGKVIFISNLSLDKLDPDGAIRTRAFIIEISPTEQEIYDFMDTIVGDIKLDGDYQLDLQSRKNVVNLLRNSKSKQSANLRKLSRALNMQAGAFKAGVSISDAELTRMIETYA